MFAKHYQFIALGIMLLLYMLILYTTDFSNLTYWMLFFICFITGKILARLLEKSSLNKIAASRKRSSETFSGGLSKIHPTS
ncbi:hypothetical protein [Neisseria meningitidis]|uniref:hypothetical protein n=1 Tax=Neisseria meningitidis TaxID=487 RepID=UPI00186532D5|nr:hypothetical protein [Neisseria meningitidis]